MLPQVLYTKAKETITTLTSIKHEKNALLLACPYVQLDSFSTLFTTKVTTISATAVGSRAPTKVKAQVGLLPMPQVAMALVGKAGRQQILVRIAAALNLLKSPPLRTAQVSPPVRVRTTSSWLVMPTISS